MCACWRKDKRKDTEKHPGGLGLSLNHSEQNTEAADIQVSHLAKILQLQWVPQRASMLHILHNSLHSVKRPPMKVMGSSLLKESYCLLKESSLN